MAAHNYRRRPLAKPGDRRAPAPRPRGRSSKRGAARRRRAFLTLVVVPALLMMGGIYLNSLAGQFEERVMDLQRQVEQVEMQNRELKVQAAELSRPERVMDGARSMGMRQPGSGSVEVFEGGAVE